MVTNTADLYAKPTVAHFEYLPSLHPGGRGVLPEKLGGGAWPASQNPQPIYD